jgi:hypothetical protein
MSTMQGVLLQNNSQQVSISIGAAGSFQVNIGPDHQEELMFVGDELIRLSDGSRVRWIAIAHISEIISWPAASPTRSDENTNPPTIET